MQQNALCDAQDPAYLSKAGVTARTKPGKGSQDMFMSIARLFHAWKRYGEAVQELSHLSDRELADIGISRSDIQRLAREHAKT